MAERDENYVAALARSLYWGYTKETTGEPGRLRDLDKQAQKLWLNMAKRALRRIDELDAADVN
jgi:hypothetical protein